MTINAGIIVSGVFLMVLLIMRRKNAKSQDTQRLSARSPFVERASLKTKKIMPIQKIEVEANVGIVREDSDPSREEVNEFLDTFDEEKATRRIDVLEDMLDILNER
jgi:hypothetical protein